MALAVIAGFNDKQPVLVLSYWISNFIKILLSLAVALSLHIYVQKLVAKKYGCSAEMDLWSLRRLSFRKESKFGIPIGIILSLLVYILSSGQMFFAAVTSLKIAINKSYRIGKKFVHLTNFESAKIAAMGPITNTFLALITSQIPHMELFTFINMAMALSYLLPLPGIDGGEMFFGSKPLYIAVVAFIITIAVMMNFISTSLTLILAIVLGITALISYLYYTHK